MATRNSNKLGIVWCMMLKLAGLVVRDFELTKRKYLHPNDTASTHTTATVTIITASVTTTVTKALATTTNSTTITTAIKTKDIKGKILGYIETAWN